MTGRKNRHGVDYELSEHANVVMAERKIPVAWLDRVLMSPDRTEPDGGDTELQHALGRIDEMDGRVLRVVYNDRSKPWRVVTVYFDRTMRKKL